MLIAEATTGVPVVDTAVAWSLGVAAVCALLGLVWRGVRAVVRIARRMDQMAEQWFGTPEQPGAPAKPGLVERVARLESRMGGLERLVGRFLGRSSGGEAPPDEGALVARPAG